MKKILITGCNGNLANVLIPILAKNFYIIGCDVDNHNSLRTNKSIELGLNKYFKCNFLNLKDIDLFINDLKINKQVPDVLINNAAKDFVPSNINKDNGMNLSDFDEIININIKAPLILCKTFIEFWRSEGISGNIINISSIYSYVSPDPKLYQSGFMKNILYGMTKSALNSITKQLAVLTAKDKIRINAVLFAGVESKSQNSEFINKYKTRIPIGRFMKNNEIIEPILFLISSKNSYMTGTLLKVDGGYTSI